MIPTRLRSAAILLLLCGCQSARASTPHPAETASAAPPSLYCERSHTNHARGYQHRGIYVDPQGAVFRYQHERGDQALLRVPADSLTEEALLARYTPGRDSVGAVAPAELAQRYRQALEARGGERSERRRRGADMGATVRRCWLHDDAGVYRELFLRQQGDWKQENLSPAARELSAWLDSLALRAR